MYKHFVTVETMNRAAYVWIYLLRDPFTEKVRYIGLTQNLHTRIRTHTRYRTRKHFNAPDFPHASLAQWLWSLHTKGRAPLIQIADRVKGCNAFDIETKLIQFYRSRGNKLFNKYPR